MTSSSSLECSRSSTALPTIYVSKKIKCGAANDCWKKWWSSITIFPLYLNHWIYGPFRNLNWRHLPYIKPMSGNIPSKYGTLIYSILQYLHVRSLTFPLISRSSHFIVTDNKGPHGFPEPSHVSLAPHVVSNEVPQWRPHRHPPAAATAVDGGIKWLIHRKKPSTWQESHPPNHHFFWEWIEIGILQKLIDSLFAYVCML